MTKHAQGRLFVEIRNILDQSNNNHNFFICAFCADVRSFFNFEMIMSLPSLFKQELHYFFYFWVISFKELRWGHSCCSISEELQGFLVSFFANVPLLHQMYTHPLPALLPCFKIVLRNQLFLYSVWNNSHLSLYPYSLWVVPDKRDNIFQSIWPQQIGWVELKE